MPIQIITQPVKEPVTLAETKDHLRVSSDDEDALISDLIIAARQQAEVFCRRAIMTQTYDYYIDEFSQCIELPNSPIQSVTSINYIDSDGVIQLLADSEYNVYTQNEPALIVPAYNKTWPATRAELNAVTIRYVAGYLSYFSVPGPIKSAILLMIGNLYENREDSSVLQVHNLPHGASSLLHPYRILTF